MSARALIGAGEGFQASRRPARPVGLSRIVDGWIDLIAPAPWSAHVGLHDMPQGRRLGRTRSPLYTPAERDRRDTSPWTTVQAILAPLQFLIFAVSLALVVRYLMTGQGYEIATISILIKTFILYTIMITGSIWEKVVFGRWLFAPAFFWEDVCSMLVLALQTAYLASLLLSFGTPREQMMIAVAAYAVYVVNAAQFVLKLREARLDGAGGRLPAGAGGAA